MRIMAPGPPAEDRANITIFMRLSLSSEEGDLIFLANSVTKNARQVKRKMPSQAVLEAKKQQVAAIADTIKNSCTGVIVDYTGTTVADDTALRKELREAGVVYQVIKNTLLKLALDSVGMSGLDDVLNGTTAIATSADDYAAPARILDQFASKHKNFKLKGGYIDGEVIPLEKVDALAKLPSREMLLTQVACVFQAPMASFARAIKAVQEKKEEGGDAPAAEAPAEAPVEAPAEAPAEAVAEAPAEAPAETPAE